MHIRAPAPRSWRHGWRSGATLSAACLAVTSAVFVAPACSGIREDEFDCESAVAHLTDCCPGFHAAFVDCTYQPSEACSAPVFPDLSIAQSTCIRAESCDALVLTDVCGRAAKLLPVNGVVDDAGGPVQTPVVCP